jgi:hypothetical protein
MEMKNSSPIKLLLRSCFYLIMALLADSLLVGMGIAYYHYFPSTSAEGSAWGSLDDGLSLAVIAGFFTLIALIWWTVKCVDTMIRNRNNHAVLWSHILLLLLVYSSMVFVFV